MNPFEIWSDRRHNRLHLVLTPTVTEEEADSAAFCALAAAKKLRPGFEINVCHDLSEFEPWSCKGQRLNSRTIVSRIIEAVCA